MGQRQKLRATELGSSAIKSCLDVGNVEASVVEEVLMGCVIQVENHKPHQSSPSLTEILHSPDWARPRLARQPWGRD